MYIYTILPRIGDEVSATIREGDSFQPFLYLLVPARTSYSVQHFLQQLASRGLHRVFAVVRRRLLYQNAIATPPINVNTSIRKRNFSIIQYIFSNQTNPLLYYLLCNTLAPYGLHTLFCLCYAAEPYTVYAVNEL